MQPEILRLLKFCEILPRVHLFAVTHFNVFSHSSETDDILEDRGSIFRFGKPNAIPRSLIGAW